MILQPFKSVRWGRIALSLTVYLGIGLLSSAGEQQYRLNTQAMEKLVMLGSFAWFFLKGRPYRGEKLSFSPLLVVLTLVIGGGFCLSGQLLMHALSLFDLFSGESRMITEALYQKELLQEIMVLILLSPAAEELLFRGVLYGELRRQLPCLISAIICSLLFALFHGNIIQAVYGFAAGMIFSLCYERCGLILIPILMHASANAVSILFMENEVLGSWISDHRTVILIGSLLITGAALAGFFRVIPDKKEKDRSEERSLL